MRYLLLLFLFLSKGWASELTLKECIIIGVNNKSIIRSALSQRFSAEQSVNIAFSDLLPFVSFSGGLNKTYFPEREAISIDYENMAIDTSIYNFSQNLSAGITFAQKIYDGGQTINRLKQTRSLFEGADFSYRSTKITVIRNVIQKYFEYLKAIELNEVAVQNLSLTEKQLELVRTQFELGAVNKTDLLKGKVKRGQAQAELLSSGQNLRSARRNFFFAMGIFDRGESFRSFNKNILSYRLPEEKMLIISIKENNPDIKVQRSLIESAKLSYMISKGMRFPLINAGINYSVIGENSKEWIDNLKDDWTLGINLSISIPIFTGKGMSSQIEQKRIQWNRQTEDFSTLRNNLNVQALDLLEVLRHYLDVLPIQSQVVESAEEDLTLIQERYSLGAASILEVLNAQVSLNQASTSWVNMKYDFWVSAASLKAFTGDLNENFGTE